MAKRDDGTTRPKIDTTDVSSATTADAIEQGVVAAKGRSGGVVDAPGKKHRKPMPTDPGANIVVSQAAKVRMAKTMVKTNRRRGRG
jgi:hypothetical protein